MTRYNRVSNTSDETLKAFQYCNTFYKTDRYLGKEFKLKITLKLENMYGNPHYLIFKFGCISENCYDTHCICI